jgi:DNA-binding NtrC family response regulator
MKVMIIEQEKTIQQSLFYFMERFNRCEVVLARSAREGISLFGSTPFDIVLCGDRLPDGNGLETLKALMKQNPKLVSVLMTVHGDELLKQEALQAGIRGYLEKPFDLKQLEEVIGNESIKNRD